MGNKEEPQDTPEPQHPGPDGITSPPSRSEAVRRALAAGFEGAAGGVAYLRKEFGIEISPSLFLAAKATERKKGWAKNGKPGRKQKQSAGSGHEASPREEEDPDEVDLID